MRIVSNVTGPMLRVARQRTKELSREANCRLDWFEHYRRLVRCYEKTEAHYQGMYQLAACMICAKRLRDGQQAGESWQPFAQAA